MQSPNFAKASFTLSLITRQQQLIQILVEYELLNHSSNLDSYAASVKGKYVYDD
jgi:hypothetical protein